MKLNDVRPRPRKTSTSLMTRAAEAFATPSTLGFLTDEHTSFEDARNAFVGVITSATDLDPWKLGADLAEEWGETVGEDYVEACEGFLRKLDELYKAEVGEWIASGGISDPVPTLARAVVKWGGETLDGIAFHEPRLAQEAQCGFVPDSARASSLNADGELCTYKVVKWEDVVQTAAPTQDDAEFRRSVEAAEELRKARSEEARVRAMARAMTDKLVNAARTMPADDVAGPIVAVSLEAAALNAAAWLAYLDRAHEEVCRSAAANG